jgi:hypothetical protein
MSRQERSAARRADDGERIADVGPLRGPRSTWTVGLEARLSGGRQEGGIELRHGGLLVAGLKEGA